VEYTPTGVTAEARSDSTVLVSWTAAPRGANGYRIRRADTDVEVGAVAGGAVSTIISGLPLGQPVAFVVEALTPAGNFRSAPSNAVSAYGRPGGPNVSVQLLARTPASITLAVTVDVVTDGGNAVTSYDIAVATASGTPLGGGQGVPIGQRPFQVVATCTTTAEICLSGGDVVATATLANAAGAGPPSSAGGTVAPPPPFNVNENAPVMMVSAGGKCLDRDLNLHTCNGGTGQLWTPRNLGDLLSAIDRACLEHRGRTRLGFTSQSDDECRNREDSVRWVHLGGGNERHFRGEGLSRCIAVLGDVRGEGTPVNLQNCQFNDQDRWFLYKQQPGVPMAAAARAAAAGGQSDVDRNRGVEDGGRGDGGLGGSVAVLLFGPLVIAVLRRRNRRRTR
jgi:hypothetical protein